MRRALIQGGAACFAALSCLTAYANTITISNHSSYLVEVSGAINVTSSHLLINPERSIKLKADGNAIAHLMLIDPAKAGYQDNVLVRMVDGKWSAVSLYGKEKITFNNNQIILER